MTFLPALPDPKSFGNAVPPLLDLIGRDLGDDLDRAAIRAAAAHPGAVALWRAWKMDPEPVRVYVLEVTGERPAAFPQVYRTGEKPHPDVRAARNAGALLWAVSPGPDLRVARVFDEVDDRGARFTPGHELLTGEELTRVADYLAAGSPVLATGSLLPDVVEPARGPVVPMSYRTDGRWLWTDSVPYYLRAYGLAPEPELLAHVRAADGPPRTGAVDEHRALALLFQSAALVPA